MKIKKSAVLLLLAACPAEQFVVGQTVLARFGGGGRDSFSHADGFGDRSFAGADNFGGGRYGNIDRSYYDHPDTPMDGAQKPLATDGGLSHYMNTDVGRLAAPVRGPVGANGVNGDAVRHAYYDHPYYAHRAFESDWWANHHDYAWYYPWMGGSYCWGCTAWPAMAAFWGMSAANQPVDYQYGNNITYQGNNVYYGTENYGTAAQYSEQANTLATSAAALPMTEKNGTLLPKLKEENEKDWKPLGVFSLVQGGQTDSSKLFQILVNKEGVIHGNYYDTMTDEVKPISGAVNKKSMRAAWKINGVKEVTYDTGLSNLMKAESPILVHYGKDKTQQWNLVRLEEPNKSAPPQDKTS